MCRSDFFKKKFYSEWLFWWKSVRWLPHKKIPQISKIPISHHWRHDKKKIKDIKHIPLNSSPIVVKFNTRTGGEVRHIYHPAKFREDPIPDSRFQIPDLEVCQNSKISKGQLLGGDLSAFSYTLGRVITRAALLGVSSLSTSDINHCLCVIFIILFQSHPDNVRSRDLTIWSFDPSDHVHEQQLERYKAETLCGPFNAECTQCREITISLHTNRESKTAQRHEHWSFYIHALFFLKWLVRVVNTPRLHWELEPAAAAEGSLNVRNANRPLRGNSFKITPCFHPFKRAQTGLCADFTHSPEACSISTETAGSGS